MTEEKSGDMEMGHPLFSQLVMMLSSSALQHLGQAPTPDGNPPAVDLRSAEFMIDLLEMLEKKTAGNLVSEEKKMLTEILAAVRLAFVRAAGNGAPAQDPAPESGAPSAAPPESGPENTKGAASPPPPAGEEPRFHKTYG